MLTYLQLAYLHLATILPAFLIGALLLVSRKGSPRHKLLGKIYMALMLVTAGTTLFMKAAIGPTLFSHFGFIHLFSLLVLYSVPSAVLAIKRGDVATHKAHMIGVYLGGIVIAGLFALMPGRLLQQLIIM